MSGVAGKVAIVTGAGQGIGRAIALDLAQNGAKVVVGDITKNIDTVLKEVNATGNNGLAIRCDVTNKGEIESLVQKTLHALRRIDILVNNAGIYPSKAFAEMTEDDWDRVLNINLKGNFLVTKAVLPILRGQKSGRVINISSVAGVVGFLNLTHYCASKAAIMGFTRALALEVAALGITVNAIAPGPIQTPGTGPMDQQQLEMIKRAIPVGRMGQPEDIAHAVTFLASDLASFITGQYIVVDGGYIAQ